MIGQGIYARYADGIVIPVHSHNWDQIAYAESGIMQLQTGDAAWIVPTTRAIWIPAGISHWIRMRGDVTMASFYVAGRSGVWPERCLAIEVTPLLRELILYLVRKQRLDPKIGNDAHLLHVLALQLQESRDVQLTLPMPDNHRARLMANAILENAGRGTLKQLAAQSGASLRTQQRLFLKETGLPLAEWRIRARVQQAIVLLSQGLSVGAVAEAIGYSSTAAFSAAFTRTTGINPSRYC